MKHTCSVVRWEESYHERNTRTVMVKNAEKLTSFKAGFWSNSASWRTTFLDCCLFLSVYQAFHRAPQSHHNNSNSNRVPMLPDNCVRLVSLLMSSWPTPSKRPIFSPLNLPSFLFSLRRSTWLKWTYVSRSVLPWVQHQASCFSSYEDNKWRQKIFSP